MKTDIDMAMALSSLIELMFKVNKLENDTKQLLAQVEQLEKETRHNDSLQRRASEA